MPIARAASDRQQPVDRRARPSTAARQPARARAGRGDRSSTRRRAAATAADHRRAEPRWRRSRGRARTYPERARREAFMRATAATPLRAARRSRRSIVPHAQLDDDVARRERRHRRCFRPAAPQAHRDRAGERAPQRFARQGALARLGDDRARRRRARSASSRANTFSAISRAGAATAASSASASAARKRANRAEGHRILIGRVGASNDVVRSRSAGSDVRRLGGFAGGRRTQEAPRAERTRQTWRRSSSCASSSNGE